MTTHCPYCTKSLCEVCRRYYNDQLAKLLKPTGEYLHKNISLVNGYTTK